MIINLFSIFDPSLNIISRSWIILFLIITLTPTLFWTTGIFFLIYKNVINIWIKEVNYRIRHRKKGVYKIITTIFILLTLYNFFALFPFIFSVTSHLTITFPLAYRFWVGIIFFSFFKSFKDFLIHLIPTGTPVGLIRFIVLIEVIRNFIRPIALTFRLTANIIAGHLLIRLIGGAVLSLPLLFITLGSITQMLLVFMELGVSVIQAYVFSTLLLLYLSESERRH